MRLLKIQLLAVAGILIGVTMGCGGQTKSTTSLDAARIINGEGVSRASELGKTTVALVEDRNEGQALCTGTIIADDTILTAAHCVDGDPQAMAIVFSPRVQNASSAVVRKAVSFMQNPAWRGSENKKGVGDLALVHFEGGLPEGYSAVELADPSFSIVQGIQVVMIGYGVTDGLNNEGAGVLRQTETTVIGQISDTQFVTDGRATSVCFGDSGGPAFAVQDGVYVQWGIASSVSNQECNQASVHTAVMAYRNWIDSAAQRLR